MLSTTLVHRCPYCQGERIYKNGHTVREAQRAKCKDCQRTFTLNPKGAAPQRGAQEAGLGRLPGSHEPARHPPPLRRLLPDGPEVAGEKAEGPPAFVDRLLPAQADDVLELDELWSFVGAKSHPLWLWVALCRRTRQVVGWILGERSLQSACDLRAHLPRGYRRCATRSDYWDAYAAAFPRRTHRACGKEAGETCHAERFFGTLRARLSRLVRRAYSFSKCAENHFDALHFFITNYNLAI